MGSWESLKLSYETQLKEAKAQIEDLYAVIDSKDDDILNLIDQVRELQRQLENRERDTWRPHR